MNRQIGFVDWRQNEWWSQFRVLCSFGVVNRSLPVAVESELSPASESGGERTKVGKEDDGAAEEMVVDGRFLFTERKRGSGVW